MGASFLFHTLDILTFEARYMFYLFLFQFWCWLKININIFVKSLFMGPPKKNNRKCLFPSCDFTPFQFIILFPRWLIVFLFSSCYERVLSRFDCRWGENVVPVLWKSFPCDRSQWQNTIGLPCTESFGSSELGQNNFHHSSEMLEEEFYFSVFQF